MSVSESIVGSSVVEEDEQTQDLFLSIGLSESSKTSLEKCEVNVSLPQLIDTDVRAAVRLCQRHAAAVDSPTALTHRVSTSGKLEGDCSIVLQSNGPFSSGDDEVALQPLAETLWSAGRLEQSNSRHRLLDSRATYASLAVAVEHDSTSHAGAELLLLQQTDVGREAYTTVQRGSTKSTASCAAAPSYSAHVTVDKLRGSEVQLIAVGATLDDSHPTSRSSTLSESQSRLPPGTDRVAGGGSASASVAVTSLVEALRPTIGAVGALPVTQSPAPADAMHVSEGKVKAASTYKPMLRATKILAEEAVLFAACTEPSGYAGQRVGSPVVHLGSLYARNATLQAYAPEAATKADLPASSSQNDRLGAHLVRIEQLHGSAVATVASVDGAAGGREDAAAPALRVDAVSGSLVATIGTPVHMSCNSGSSRCDGDWQAQRQAYTDAGSSGPVRTPDITCRITSDEFTPPSNGMASAGAHDSCSTARVHFDEFRGSSSIAVEDPSGTVDVTILAKSSGSSSQSTSASAELGVTPAAAGGHAASFPPLASAVLVDAMVFRPRTLSAAVPSTTDGPPVADQAVAVDVAVHIDAPAHLARWQTLTEPVNKQWRWKCQTRVAQAASGASGDATSVAQSQLLSALRVRGILHLTPRPSDHGISTSNSSSCDRDGRGRGGSSGAVAPSAPASSSLSGSSAASFGGSGKIREGVAARGFFTSDSNHHDDHGLGLGHAGGSKFSFSAVAAVASEAQLKSLPSLSIVVGHAALIVGPTASGTGVAQPSAAMTTPTPSIRIRMLDWPSLVRSRMAETAAAKKAAARLR